MNQLLLAHAMLAGWLHPSNPHRPLECPEREVLSTANEALGRACNTTRLTASQVAHASRLFDQWQRAHEAVPVLLQGSRHLVLVGQVQAWLDVEMTAIRAAHAQRRARGRAVDTRLLTVVEGVNAALGALDRVIAERTRHAGERMLAAEHADRIATMGGRA